MNIGQKSPILQKLGLNPILLPQIRFRDYFELH